MQYIQSVSKMLGHTLTMNYLHKNKKKEVYVNIYLEISGLQV